MAKALQLRLEPHGLCPRTNISLVTVSKLELKPAAGANGIAFDISQPEVDRPGAPKTGKVALRRTKRGKTVETGKSRSALRLPHVAQVFPSMNDPYTNSTKDPVVDILSEKADDNDASVSRQNRARALIDKFFPVFPPLAAKRAAEQERVMSPTKRFKTAHLTPIEADFNHYSLPESELLRSQPQSHASHDMADDEGRVTEHTVVQTDMPEYVYFFAYDHLMREDFMLREYPDAVPMGVAKIEGWRFCLAGPRREGK